MSDLPDWVYQEYAIITRFGFGSKEHRDYNERQLFIMIYDLVEEFGYEVVKERLFNDSDTEYIRKEKKRILKKVKRAMDKNGEQTSPNTL